VAPWRSLQSGDVYTIELFTVGGDKRIAHWGLRKEDIHPPPTDNSTPPVDEVIKTPDYTYKVDLLGVRLIVRLPILRLIIFTFILGTST